MEKHELINKAIELKKANTSLINKNKRLISLNKKLTEQLILTDVSHRRELYFAFMEEYNSLMGKSEHQILKEEVVVLLAKYCG